MLLLNQHFVQDSNTLHIVQVFCVLSIDMTVFNQFKPHRRFSLQIKGNKLCIYAEKIYFIDPSLHSVLTKDLWPKFHF